jgi:hypothetical protein
VEVALCLVELRGFEPLTPLHAMQFRAPPPPQVRDRRPAQRPPSSDRDCPLDTAGDRCLWHAGGTAGENVDASTERLLLPLSQAVRPVLGDHRLVGKSPEGSRQPGGDSNSGPPRELA